MIVHRITGCCLLFCAALLFWPKNAAAHGGVVEEDDLCVIKVNYLRAHFKVYQPAVTGHKQYCEDLPVAAESVFVMEYQHDALSVMPVDFRIIRDVTGKGRFARMEDVERIENIGDATVFYRSAMVEPDVYIVNHEFTEEGDFIGIVSAQHPQTGKLYAAVFPFEVGFTGPGYWPFFIGLLLLVQLQYLLMSGRLKKCFGGGLAVAVLLTGGLFLPPAVSADELLVTYTVPDHKVELNRMHSWILHIEDASGGKIEGATIAVSGGMPEHDHGLPTEPRVTKDLGGGNYKLEGMRFHMRGRWEIVVTVITDNGTSVATITLQL